MAHSPTTLVLASGIFDLALALFHMTFWTLFQWPASLGSLGNVNRKILYILNLAVTALFILAGVLLLAYSFEVSTTGLGVAMLWGWSFFWLARAALQPAMFGLKRPLSWLLFLVFLLGSGLHGFAALSRSAI
jgi:hypothetical protein